MASAARARPASTVSTTPATISAAPAFNSTTSRGAPGRKGTTMDMTISTWDPPRSYGLRGAAAGYVFDSQIRCVPHGASGTRLEMEIVGRPTNFVAKLFSPLVAILSRMMVKHCAKDLADIARAAEGRNDAKNAGGR